MSPGKQYVQTVFRSVQPTWLGNASLHEEGASGEGEGGATGGCREDFSSQKQDGQLEEWWLEGKYEGKDGEGEDWERSLRRREVLVESHLESLAASQPPENLMWSGDFENLLVTFICLAIPVIAIFKLHQKSLVCLENIYIHNSLWNLFLWQERVGSVFFFAKSIHRCVKGKFINDADIKSIWSVCVLYNSHMWSNLENCCNHWNPLGNLWLLKDWSVVWSLSTD